MRKGLRDSDVLLNGAKSSVGEKKGDSEQGEGLRIAGGGNVFVSGPIQPSPSLGRKRRKVRQEKSKMASSVEEEDLVT